MDVRLNCSIDDDNDDNDDDDCKLKENGITRTNELFDAPQSSGERLLRMLSNIEGVKDGNTLKMLQKEIATFNATTTAPRTACETYDVPQLDGYTYGKILQRVIDIFNDNWPFTNNNIDPTVEQLIVIERATPLMFHESLVALTDALRSTNNERRIHGLALLLERLTKSQALRSVVAEQARRLVETSAIEREEREAAWQSTLQIIVSLPERVANKLGKKTKSTFLPEIYAKIMAAHICESILFLNDEKKSRTNVEPDTTFLSMLLSKVVIVLGAFRLFPLFDITAAWCCQNRENIRDCIGRVLNGVERAAIEPIALQYLRISHGTIRIDNIFGNLTENRQWRHVFTVKIPLMSYYHENDDLIKNLASYLSSRSSVDGKDRILPDLLIRILDVWADRSALNHTPFEHHLYITKLILVSANLVKDILSAEEKATARRLLFAGTSAHLESTRANVRGIGMITGEIIIEMMRESEDAPKLKYDYEGMSEETLGLIEGLRNLVKSTSSIKNFCQDDSLKNHDENTGERKLEALKAECGLTADAAPPDLPSCESTESRVTGDGGVTVETAGSKSDSSKSIVIIESRNDDDDDDLDSDDEPIAYDMSNDTAISKDFRPVYLRDLQENLVNAQFQNNPDIFAESLLAAEDLILSQLPNDDPALGIELLEILVTLSEASHTKNFESLKFRACLAVVLVYPNEAAKYLCNEFHAEIGAYSVKDRLFILDLLGESARKLSKIETREDDANSTDDSRGSKSKARKVARPISLIIHQNEVNRHETLYDDDFEIFQDTRDGSGGRTIVPDWREILDARIESKTRRFVRTSNAAGPKTTVNRFNDAAASFFYPLLYGLRKTGTTACMRSLPKSFEDQENILLVNYLKTLSVIMMSAENCVIVPKMAEAILNLAWNLRYHNDASVRLSVIEMIASALITLPKEALTPDIAELIFELRLWLADASSSELAGGDPDSRCRAMAPNVIAVVDLLVQSLVKN